MMLFLIMRLTVFLLQSKVSTEIKALIISQAGTKEQIASENAILTKIRGKNAGLSFSSLQPKI